MAEKSSSLTTFRAFVMLFCVVLIPFAAVCGTSFPAVLKAIQSGRLPTLADFRGPGPADKSNLSEAPAFVPPGGTPSFNASDGAGGPAIFRGYHNGQTRAGRNSRQLQRPRGTRQHRHQRAIDKFSPKQAI